MKIAIVQFDNRPLEQLGALPFLVGRNREYAERHGYEHRFLDKAYFDLPVYWQKPSICRRVLEAGYDAVAWIDTDAVVHDFDRRLEAFFEGPEVMVAAGDNPYWTSPFNAGVFFVRGAAGARLMARWAELFAGAAWRRTETAWVCRDEWAGPSYEQGAFVKHLLETAVATGELRLLDWNVLQAPYPMAGAFTLHFAGPFKANLPAYLRTI
jgi:hypothetical protein